MKGYLHHYVGVNVRYVQTFPSNKTFNTFVFFVRVRFLDFFLFLFLLMLNV